MDGVLQRFLRYVQIDTQSQENSPTYPSTTKQLDLCRLLAEECTQLGLADVSLSEFGIVTATIPPTVPHQAPAICWVAHVDTSPEHSGTAVRPIVHENYQGQDLVLPSDPSQVLRPEDNPALQDHIGGTVVTTDGTTLLGADDKAGVAVIMQAAEFLMTHREIQHGPVKLCFTCDEEVGHGVDHVDLPALNCVCAYTLDGEGKALIDCETFSADLAVVTVQGINIHPSIAQGKMVNAVRILADFLGSLPQDRLSPETTSGREGFLHPYQIEGGVARASARILLRDFETARLDEYGRLLEEIAQRLQAVHPGASITVQRTVQYRNMGEGLAREPRAVAKAQAAMKAIGVEPRLGVIRGGTDGSRLTELGLPTPNLSTGEHNPHSLLEWTSLEELQVAVRVLVSLAEQWGQEVV